MLAEALTSEIAFLIADSLLLPAPTHLFCSLSLPPALSSPTVPSASVSLSTTQQGSDILLTWGEIPLVVRRGFLLGYNIYVSSGSELTLLGKRVQMHA